MVRNEFEDYINNSGSGRSWFTEEKFSEYKDRHFIYVYSFKCLENFETINLWCKENFENNFCLSEWFIRCKTEEDLFKFKLRI